MPLPRERRLPGGGGIGIILRYDKMYIWHQYDASGNRAGLNTEEFFVVRESSRGIVVEPRPEKGMSISRDNRVAIIRRLKQCSNAEYLSIGLWPDTFDQWQVFREIIVDADYRYRLLLMKRGEVIIDRGGTDAWAQ